MPVAARRPPASEEDLLRAYGGFVKSLVRRFSRRAGSEFDPAEGFQIACLATLRAVRAYDPSQINPATGRPYAVTTTIGLSVHRELRKYVDRQGRRGLVRRMGGTGESSPEVLPEVVNVGLLTSVDEVSPDLLRCMAVTDDEVHLREMDRIWEVAQQNLTHREYWILWSTYAMGMPQAEVARRLGVSKVRVGQIHKIACDKLRPHLEGFG